MSLQFRPRCCGMQRERQRERRHVLGVDEADLPVKRACWSCASRTTRPECEVGKIGHVCKIGHFNHRGRKDTVHVQVSKRRDEDSAEAS